MASEKTRASSSAGSETEAMVPAMRWRRIALLAVVLTLALAFKQKGLDRASLQSTIMPLIPSSLLTIDQRVDKIMARTPMMDGHIDLAERLRSVYSNHIYHPDFRSKFEHGGSIGYIDHLDIARMRKGRQGGFFWSCWVDCPSNRLDFSNEVYAPVVVETLSQLDVIHRLQATFPDVFSPAILDSVSALAAFQRKGKVLSPIGIEGLHMIGRNASTLRLYHKLGAKYATLTWNCHNAVADAAQVTVLDDSLDPEAARPASPHWGGLSPFGTKIIREMNRLGMIVDLSHTHPKTMHDVLAGNQTKSFPGSEAPVIFSHSSAYALCPHPRNVPDQILPLVKGTDSVIMVTFVPQFISCVNSTTPGNLPTFHPANSTLEFVVEHVMYLGNKIGFEHVGIGSDFDGIPETPRGLEDVSKFPDLVRELLRRGLDDAQVEGVIGGNVLRVWKRVEEVSAEMKARGDLPLEDEI
ncbi:uncharacterized protein PV06_04012 [Exophiala oligosperma]|uniref:Dipeptidase n=1 Tax=Exophiala oligosperma TaxID=215243 RepID=A0A0D2ECE6_9EURO|nr:uncharacterized protein PV06_04012 [Exophiala oligosperma]KIW45639.1 hypothetical protein PV06_04012 [Exophiala oligosperma]